MSDEPSSVLGKLAQYDAAKISTQPLYDEWSQTYEQEVVRSGADGNTQMPLGYPIRCRRQPIPCFLEFKEIPKLTNRLEGIVYLCRRISLLSTQSGSL